MAKAVRSVRKYTAADLHRWMQLPLDVVRKTSMKDPRGELPIPFDHIRIIAMHHMLDRRNQPDCVWLDRHVFIHARLAGGLPAVSPGDVPVDALVARFEKGESPPEIASALGLDVAAVASALAWAQKTARGNAAWRKKPITQKAAPKKPAVLHGPLLVKAAIAHARQAKREEPKAPMSAARIAALDLDGVAVPKSLSTWLAFSTGRVACATKAGLVPATLREVMRKLGYRLDQPALEAALPSRCYVLEVGDTQATFLYAGVAEDGELPVFTIDVDGVPSAWVSFPGFDVYIAARTDYLETSDGDPLPGPYRARMRAHERRFEASSSRPPRAGQLAGALAHVRINDALAA